TNSWIYRKGDSLTVTPVYGTQGVSNPANKPEGRVYNVGWTDASNNLWVFGDPGNELWKYNLLTNEWTFVKGKIYPAYEQVYGTRGVPALSNNPPTRQGGTGWTDQTGKLWLFGGLIPRFDANGFSLNDLWRYDPSTNEWTWMNGDSVVLVDT